MKRLFAFSGIIAWVFLIGYGIDYVLKHPNLSSLLTKTLAYFGGIVLVALTIWIALRAMYGKDWMLGFGKQLVIGNDLIKATDNFLGSPNRETTANLIAHLVYRFTRLGLIALLLAMIPIWLLYQQNVKIDAQNILITHQNKRLDQQTYLQEAERRSSLVFLFSNVMDAIDRELKDDIGEKEVRDLSPQLIGRIIALSNRLKPYQYLDGDSLISKPLSPERGQLLVSLLGSELDTSTLDKIYEKATFAEADLRGANLRKMYLVNVNLNGANLNDVDLFNANLQRADLSGASLDEAHLSKADLIWTDLSNANLKKAWLEEANLVVANLQYSDLSEANLNEANLSGITLNDANLSKVDLSRAIIVDANLFRVNLSEADLSDANLSRTILQQADIHKANLSRVMVKHDFLKDIITYKTFSTKNTNYILNNYSLDSIKQGETTKHFLKEVENK